MYIYIYRNSIYLYIHLRATFFGYVLCLSAAIIRTTHRSGYIALAVCGGVEAQEEKPQQQCVSHSYIYMYVGVLTACLKLPPAAPPCVIHFSSKMCGIL